MGSVAKTVAFNARVPATDPRLFVQKKQLKDEFCR